MGMKTAISIPKDIFQKTQRLARRRGTSHSQLVSDALWEYIARHATEGVPDAMDQVCAEPRQSPDLFVSAAARRILERSECSSRMARSR